MDTGSFHIENWIGFLVATLWNIQANFRCFNPFNTNYNYKGHSHPLFWIELKLSLGVKGLKVLSGECRLKVMPDPFVVFLAHMWYTTNTTSSIVVRSAWICHLFTYPLKILGQLWTNVVCMTFGTKASKLVQIGELGPTRGQKLVKLGQT